MALSGSISKTIESIWRLRLQWSATQDIANNRSTVTAILYWESLESYGTINAPASFPSAIQYNNGSWHIKNATAALTGKQTKEINRITFTINHNSDGTASFSLDGYFDVNSTLRGKYYSRIDLDQKTFTLNTIPRASSISASSSNVNFGSSVSFSISRASSSFTHTIKYSFAGQSGTIASGVGTSTSWTVPNTLMNRIPNATSGSCTITCETYSGSTKIGTKSINITLNVPSNIVPSFNTITHSETVSNVASKIGSYVQGLSKLSLAITGASGAYGSTIKSYEIKFDGSTHTKQSVTTGAIKGSGSMTITGKITDSRGRTASKSVTISVLAYQAPKITTLTLIRANSDGSPNEIGTYAKVTRAGSWHSLGGKNAATVVIKSRPRGTTTWTTKHTASSSTSGTFSGSITVGTYPAESSYEFRIEVQDQFNTTVANIVLPTGIVTMSWGKQGIGIGKIHEQGALDVNGDIYGSGKLVIHRIETGTNIYLSDGGGLNMNNSDIINVNSLHFADPGGSEGIFWSGGNGWGIVEAPDDLSNNSGQLQFYTGYPDNRVRRMTLSTAGNLFLTGTRIEGGTNMVFGATEGYVVLRAAPSGSYAYIQSDVEARVTRVAQGSNYVPIRASSFPTASSILYKTNIEPLSDEEALFLLDNADIYTYHIQSNIDMGVYDKPKIGMLSELVPQKLRDEDGVDPYCVVSALWKVVQIQKRQIEELKDRVLILEEVV